MDTIDKECNEVVCKDIQKKMEMTSELLNDIHGMMDSNKTEVEERGKQLTEMLEFQEGMEQKVKELPKIGNDVIKRMNEIQCRRNLACWICIIGIVLLITAIIFIVIHLQPPNLQPPSTSPPTPKFGRFV